MPSRCISSDTTPGVSAVSRQVFVVLGMHRSGTSAAAGLLARLGVLPPRTTMPPDVSNTSGYGESMRFWGFHERLLRDVGSRWDSCTSLDAAMREWSTAADWKGECRQLLREEFGDAPRFVLKDPRLCRIMPFWLDVLAAEAVRPLAILVFRNPMEVARSLRQRNGLEPGLALLIWLRHVLDAERHTRAIPRTFLEYDDLLRDWRAAVDRITRDLNVSLQPRTASEEAAIDAFVDESLHHQRAELDSFGDETPVLAAWIRRSWEALRQLRDGRSASGAVPTDLDTIRVEFDLATAALGGVCDRVRGGFEADIAGMRSHLQRLQEESAALEADRASLQDQVTALERASDTLQRHSQATQRENELLENALVAARQDARDLRESGSWRITAPLRAIYRIFR